MVNPVMRRRAALARRNFVIGVTPLALLSSFLPDDDSRRTVSFVSGVAILGVLVWSLRRYQARAREPWVWFAAGLAMWALGGVANVLLKALHTGSLGGSGALTIADLIWLSTYPFLYVGGTKLLTARGARPDRRGLLDCLIVVVAMFTFPGILLVRRILANYVQGQPVDAMIDVLAYPLLDVGLLALVAWILTSRAASNPILRYLALGLVFEVTADFVNAWYGPDAGAPGWLDGIYLLAVSMIVLASMHISPVLPQLAEVHSHREVDARWVALISVSVVLPLAGIGVALAQGDQVALVGCVAGLLVVLGIGLYRVLLMMSAVRSRVERLNMLAYTDDLTRLPNRRSILGYLAETAAGPDRPITLAIIDLDHFKTFNDTYGHGGGDELLIAAAASWKHALGGNGRLGRLGGEEFLVVLPGVSPEQSRLILSRMRRATPSGQTFSAGATELMDEDVSAALKRADEALYQAKTAGRDRTVTTAA